MTISAVYWQDPKTHKAGRHLVWSVTIKSNGFAQTHRFETEGEAIEFREKLFSKNA